MEWSKEKTLKLINLLQVNASLWNPSLCDTRRDKQKRREELRIISEILDISIPDTTKKIQHLRTQYNRESAREVRANVEDPNDSYISSWYAYEYLHFMKDSSKHYRLVQCEHSDGNSTEENKYTDLSPPQKITRLDSMQGVKSEQIYPKVQTKLRDEFSVFGEYVANELRSLKGEKNLLVAKKKIQDVIFEVKMGLINEPRETSCTIYHTGPGSQSPKLYSSPVTAHIQPMPTHTSTTGISEIIINGACHYSNFKVDNQ